MLSHPCSSWWPFRRPNPDKFWPQGLARAINAGQSHPNSGRQRPGTHPASSLAWCASAIAGQRVCQSHTWVSQSVRGAPPRMACAGAARQLCSACPGSTALPGARPVSRPCSAQAARPVPGRSVIRQASGLGAPVGVRRGGLLASSRRCCCSCCDAGHGQALFETHPTCIAQCPGAPRPTPPLGGLVGGAVAARQPACSCMAGWTSQLTSACACA